MDEKEAVAVALLAIQPRYADAILKGQKSVEFRKRDFRKSVLYVAMYATSPMQRIVGIFKIARVVKDTPTKLWSKYAPVGCVAEKDYKTYFQNVDSAVGIEIENVIELDNPLRLEEVSDKLIPPQSYIYLSNESIKRLQKHLVVDQNINGFQYQLHGCLAVDGSAEY